MNKKVKNLIIGLVVLFTFFFILYGLLILTWFNTIILGIIFLIMLYLFNFGFLFDLVFKKHNDKQGVYSWIFLFVVFPGVGGIIYYFYGYIPTPKKDQLEKLYLLESELVEDTKYSLNQKNTDPFFNLNYDNLNRRVISNSEIEFLNGAKNKYKNLFEELKSAKAFIAIQYFIINDGIIWNKFKNILLKKAEEGIEVRILMDYIGCIQTDDRAYEDLKYTKIKFVAFNKTKYYVKSGFLNYRSHNKFVIIDNKIAYFGGMNIGDDYASLYPKYGIWFDLQIKAKGEIVNEMYNHFITQWYIATEERLGTKIKHSVDNDLKIQFLSDGPEMRLPVFSRAFIDLVNKTEKTIKIVTPYLVLPNDIRSALKRAAKRGVKIEIITAGRADKRSAFVLSKFYADELIGAGIKIYRTLNIFIHTKFYLFDDQEIISGTTNLDYRALFLHFEANLLIKDSKKSQELLEIFKLYRSNSYLEEITNNRFIHNLKRSLYTLVSPIF